MQPNEPRSVSLAAMLSAAASRQAADRRGRSLRVAQEILGACLAIGGFLAAMWLISQSFGFYQDDDICHYNLACEGWTNPQKAWHRWGRPGYTLPAMPVARAWGMQGCRVFSAAQMMLVAYLAFRIAMLIAPRPGGSRRVVNVLAGVAPALAPALVWAQPLAMQLSLTTLTEIPAALYLTLAAWLCLRGNRVLAGLALSPMFITRYESVALAPIFLAVAWLDARAKARAGAAGLAPNIQVEFMGQVVPDASGPITPPPTPVGAGREPGRVWLMGLAMLWAPAMYLVVTIALALPETASPLAMFHRSYTDQYGSGDWKHYLVGWMTHAAGAGILAMAAAGAIALGRRARLVTFLAIGLVALHTVIYMRGMFESGGYIRFLLPASGMVGALAACGIGVLLRWRHRLAAVGAIAVLIAGLYWTETLYPQLMPATPEQLARLNWPFLMLVVAAVLAAVVRWSWLRAWVAWGVIGLAMWGAAAQFGGMVRPLTFSHEDAYMAAADAVEGLGKTEYAQRPGLSRLVLIPYLRPNTVLTDDCGQALAMWLDAPPGTLFFWDNKYCQDRPDHSNPLLDGLKSGGLRVWGAAHGKALIEVFERLPE